jgi:hypothetical protein
MMSRRVKLRDWRFLWVAPAENVGSSATESTEMRDRKAHSSLAVTHTRVDSFIHLL